MRAALEQRPVPCTSWQTAVAAALVGPSLAAVERGTGTLGGVVGRLADAVRE
jgi:hypothetical protein